MKVSILTKNITKNILLENRVKDIKKKYPELADGTGEYPIVDYFVANDPSGNNKYLDWMVKAMLHKPTTDAIMELLNDFSWKEGIWGNVAGFIVNMVTDFHSLLPYMVHDGEGTTDLYAYKFTDSEMINYLFFDIERAAERKNIKEKEKDAKKNSDKVYEDSDWLVVRPKTWEASCVYGAGTKWCTTSKVSSSHFKRETNRNFLFYVISKLKDEESPTKKVAWQIPYTKNVDTIINDDGTINTEKVNLWNVKDVNIKNSSYAYLEEVPLKLKLKIKKYMKSAIESLYVDFNEDPKIQSLIDLFGLTTEDVNSIEILNLFHYGMPIYNIESKNAQYAVADDDELREAQLAWAESYINDVGEMEVLSNMSDIERYITISDAKIIAAEDARYRIEDFDDEALLEEASIMGGKFTTMAESYEIDASIFSSNENDIDELESKDELTNDESVELEDLKLENKEIEKDLRKKINSLREAIYETYYDYTLDRLEAEPLDWLWEMGYYDKKNRVFTENASNIIEINSTLLTSDLAEDIELETFQETGDGYYETTVGSNNYFIFGVDYYY